MISVIVPVYNEEKYLRACVDSILAQTFRDFELILVDDGSTDNSSLICDDYAEKDYRVKVIHQKNGGVSSARNRGLDIANGEYVTFIDSDDWVLSDYLENLNARAAASKCDLITSGLIWWYNDVKHDADTLENVDIMDLSVESDLIRIISQKQMTSPVCKLYKLAIIKKYDLSFDIKIAFGEDRDFNVRFLKYINNVSTIEYVGYFYRRGLSDSLSVLKLNYDYRADLDYWVKLRTLFVMKGFASEPTKQLLCHRLFFIISDSILDIVKNNSVLNSAKEIKKLFNYVPDWDFIYSNCNLISAPRVLKKLIFGRFALMLSLYLKLR